MAYHPYQFKKYIRYKSEFSEYYCENCVVICEPLNSQDLIDGNSPL